MRDDYICVHVVGVDSGAKPRRFETLSKVSKIIILSIREDVANAVLKSFVAKTIVHCNICEDRVEEVGIDSEFRSCLLNVPIALSPQRIRRKVIIIREYFDYFGEF